MIPQNLLTLAFEISEINAFEQTKTACKVPHCVPKAEYTQPVLSPRGSQCLCRCHAAGRRAESESERERGLKDKAAAAWFVYPLYRSPSLSLTPALSASADHLAGALGNSCRLVKATTRCAAAAGPGEFAVTHATSPQLERHTHTDSCCRRCCQKLEDRLIGFICRAEAPLPFYPASSLSRATPFQVGTTYARREILYLKHIKNT